MLQDLTQEDIIGIVEWRNVDFLSDSADTIGTYQSDDATFHALQPAIEGKGVATAFR